MTQDELREINRRVALAMGWRWQEPGEWRDAMWRTADDNPTFSSGCFTTDPAATDLVRQEIERRGWDIDICSRIQPDTGKARHRVFVGKNIQTDGAYTATKDWLGVALCLAFLAACDTQKEQEAKR